MDCRRRTAIPNEMFQGKERGAHQWWRPNILLVYISILIYLWIQRHLPCWWESGTTSVTRTISNCSYFGQPLTVWNCQTICYVLSPVFSVVSPKQWLSLDFCAHSMTDLAATCPGSAVQVRVCEQRQDMVTEQPPDHTISFLIRCSLPIRKWLFQPIY